MEDKSDWIARMRDVLSVNLSSESLDKLQCFNDIGVNRDLDDLKFRFIMRIFYEELSLNNSGELSKKENILERYSRNDPVYAARSYIEARMKHDRVYTVDKIMDSWKNISKLIGHVSMMASYQIERKSWSDSVIAQQKMWNEIMDVLLELIYI